MNNFDRVISEKHLKTTKYESKLTAPFLFGDSFGSTTMRDRQDVSRLLVWRPVQVIREERNRKWSEGLLEKMHRRRLRRLKA
ncbi:hypothetical protein [Paraburkholderia diazotrophica]|nr:hypothetical protein [Paraburkholderia diazotrophica]